MDRGEIITVIIVLPLVVLAFPIILMAGILLVLIAFATHLSDWVKDNILKPY